MSTFKSLDSISDEMESAPLGVNFSTVEYTFDTFLKKIEDGSIGDAVIQDNILYSYKLYLDYDNFNEANTRTVFQALWTNPRFLKNFIKLLKDKPELVKEMTSYHFATVNKIVYDYYATNLNGEKDSEVMDLLFDICEIIDMKYIIQLSTVMDVKAALFITMAKFSSFDQEICVDRLNEFIIKLGYDFSIKDIIYIYARFYTDNFSALFNYTMTYVCNREEMPPEYKKNYDNISLSILYILESMTSEDIYKVLKQYGSYIMLMKKGISVRFSLHGLSDDFCRINEVIDKMNANDDYISIP